MQYDREEVGEMTTKQGIDSVAVSGGVLPRLWTVYLALVYAVVVTHGTGLMGGWGVWYSENPAHHAQVAALLRGRLALSRDPSALRFDECWSEGGVHQVWGLGIPLWRLPFEAAARVWGAPIFPDLLCLLVALAGVAYALLRALDPLLSGVMRTDHGTRVPGRDDRGIGSRLLWLFGAAGVVLCFPPFLRLLHTRFHVYEQAVAYEYLVGVLLVACLVRLVRRACGSCFAWLGLVAGYGMFVRPTLVFHGVAALLSGALWLWFSGRTVASERGAGDPPGRTADPGTWFRAVAPGVVCFIVAGGLLYLTNHLRFGNGFEFGHRLNVQNLYGSMYATRFDHPYEDEPITSAARELFGLLFLPKRYSWNQYETNQFVGQSPTVRWREVGMPTYDLTYPAVLLPVWAIGLFAWTRLWRPATGAPDTAGETRNLLRGVCAVLGTYSLLGSTALAVFYLRNCVIATRYMLDFMPSFAAAFLVAWGLWMEGCRRLKRLPAWLPPVVSVLGWAVWSGWQASFENGIYGTPNPLTREAALKALEDHLATRPVTLPQVGCYEGAEAARRSGIPFNGAGWSAGQEGALMPCTILFVDQPCFLRLELRENPNSPVPADPHGIRAKVGLEYLRLENVERQGDLWIVTFAGPRQRRYQTGLQPVFLATVSKEHLAATEGLPWRLIRVCWR